MRVQISQQSFFDLVNDADRRGIPYAFVRWAPVNDASAREHIELVADELGLRIAITRSCVRNGHPDVSFHLELPEEN